MRYKMNLINNKKINKMLLVIFKTIKEKTSFINLQSLKIPYYNLTKK